MAALRGACSGMQAIPWRSDGFGSAAAHSQVEGLPLFLPGEQSDLLWLVELKQIRLTAHRTLSSPRAPLAA